MADEAPPIPEAEDDLDLRQLASRTRPVLTSAGRLELRRFAALGPIDRTRVIMAQVRAGKRAAALDELDFAAPDAEEKLAAAAEDLGRAEDDLLRLLIVDVTDEQLADLDAPERVGIIAAFFGAAPEAARGAVADATKLMEMGGVPLAGRKRSRGSSGSTAGTRRAG